MESKDSASAEALRAIEVSFRRLQRIMDEHQFRPPPSGYGPYVDAVVRKAAEYWVLSEIARVEARIAVVKRLLAARLAQALSAMAESPPER